VLIVPGDGTITIASEDPAALDQLESLLATLSERLGYAGRDFSIYPIRNAGAASVAATLSQLFRPQQRTDASSTYYPRTYRRRVVIVPDERLNTILVQGSRADRSKIESLLKILDTDQVPDTPEAHKPKLIPIKNTTASRIEQVIREMFRSRLGSRGASATGSSVPSWLSSEVTVDEVTNSLVIRAPAPLIDDITQLAEQLDRAAGEDPSRGLKIIRLQKANAASVQEALDMIIEDSIRLRSRP
jgi:type II secretory pathway component GspD/PulD (secretin)